MSQLTTSSSITLWRAEDNSTVAIASRTDDGYIGRQHWYDVAGGPRAAMLFPTRGISNIVYAGSGNGALTRWDKRTMARRRRHCLAS